MIFATVGTQEAKFDRFIDIINSIEECDVKFQYGHLNIKCRKKNIEYFDFTSDFNEFIKKSDIIISHGGVGSIMQALEENKPIIVIPRLVEYKEHVDNHQLEIVEKFEKNGYLYYLRDENINEVIKNIISGDIKFKKYPFEKSSFSDKIVEIVGGLIND